MNTEQKLINQLKTSPENIQFDEVISTIQKHYSYTPTIFTNGSGTDSVINNAGENEGSCKIFAFAQLHNLTKQQTLHCFGDYYREDVLGFPEKKNHENIRQFMKYGWDHMAFENKVLTKK
ncbi:MAG: type III effector [Thiotrichaceae bacterium]|nr:MAG: type III effector [Thiotrichaceae bacterium]